MQSDAVQVENKPLEYRFLLLGALSIQTYEAVNALLFRPGHGKAVVSMHGCHVAVDKGGVALATGDIP